MNSIVSGPVGLFHFFASIIALITGLWVLIAVKGTRKHRQIGYVYAGAMITVNITAFLIYRLFQKFGIFHWFAVISLVTLCMGMYPILAKRGRNYLVLHFNFMYWSVIGLYAAFCAEIFTRIPFIFHIENTPRLFFMMTGISMLFVLVFANIYFARMRPQWAKQYAGQKG